MTPGRLGDLASLAESADVTPDGTLARSEGQLNQGGFDAGIVEGWRKNLVGVGDEDGDGGVAEASAITSVVASPTTKGKKPIVMPARGTSLTLLQTHLHGQASPGGSVFAPGLVSTLTRGGSLSPSGSLQRSPSGGASIPSPQAPSPKSTGSPSFATTPTGTLSSVIGLSTAPAVVIVASERGSFESARTSTHTEVPITASEPVRPARPLPPTPLNMLTGCTTDGELASSSTFVSALSHSSSPGGASLSSSSRSSAPSAGPHTPQPATQLYQHHQCAIGGNIIANLPFLTALTNTIMPPASASRIKAKFFTAPSRASSKHPVDAASPAPSPAPAVVVPEVVVEQAERLVVGDGGHSSYASAGTTVEEATGVEPEWLCVDADEDERFGTRPFSFTPSVIAETVAAEDAAEEVVVDEVASPVVADDTVRPVVIPSLANHAQSLVDGDSESQEITNIVAPERGANLSSDVLAASDAVLNSAEGVLPKGVTLDTAAGEGSSFSTPSPPVDTVMSPLPNEGVKVAVVPLRPAIAIPPRSTSQVELILLPEKELGQVLAASIEVLAATAADADKPPLPPPKDEAEPARQVVVPEVEAVVVSPSDSLGRASTTTGDTRLTAGRDGASGTSGSVISLEDDVTSAHSSTKGAKVQKLIGKFMGGFR
ncbi:hypothetical protein HK101_004644 [Irineochytrium annulatum]|nr:hypothetical protein HK101_004644 [Irineochytrium annulatum]